MVAVVVASQTSSMSTLSASEVSAEILDEGTVMPTLFLFRAVKVIGVEGYPLKVGEDNGAVVEPVEREGLVFGRQGWEGAASFIWNDGGMTLGFKKGGAIEGGASLA
jgi:hypothetical protein